jgi:hypothetical protein
LTTKGLVYILVIVEDVSWNAYATPTLMRAARGAYAQSIRAELGAAGFDDLPRNAAFLLAGIESSGGSEPGFPSQLGVTKQAISQAIDVLVNRGYVTRHPHPSDRRRVALELTDRGQEVLAVVIWATEAIDQQLEERITPDQIEGMRSGLIALAEIKAIAIESGAGRRRPGRELRRVCPIFPVRDLAAALRHYGSLGFVTSADGDGSEYGFATRDGIEIHLARHPNDRATGPGSAYLFVRDADALFEEWSRPDRAGRTNRVEVTPYKIREGSHVDPDGNLIRFGSPIEE